VASARNQLALVLMMADTAAKGDFTRDNVRSFMSENVRATMGRLVSLLKPHLAHDDDLFDDLALALEVRNHLAHSFLLVHSEDIGSFTGREEVLDHLSDAIKMFRMVSRRLEPIADRFVVSRGGNLDELERRVRRRYTEIEQRARARDSDRR
jgi:hypothetical protein